MKTANMSDAIVIGGGLHGLSAGLQLARRGVGVIVLERARIGCHASGASAAGVRTLGRAAAELPIAFAAKEMWPNMIDLVGDDCGFDSSGQLKVAEDESELVALRERASVRHADGFTHEEIIGRDHLRELVPALAPHCVGAMYVRGDGAADPHRTIAAFLKSAQEGGVRVEEGVEVLSLDRRGEVWHVETTKGPYEAPLLVNAAGAWGGRVAAMAGDQIPLDDTMPPMMMVTERVAPLLKPTVTSFGRKLSFKQTAQGTILIGGGHLGRADLDRQTADVDGRAGARSAVAALALFPSVSQLRIVRMWAALEARATDDIAIAGLSALAPGLLHLFGFSGHGFQLVPALGVAAAELLVEGRSKIDIDGLSPRRFFETALS
jgi:sarcosine oxidase subunit beta